jgi:2-iminoacetate synthase
MIYMATMSLNDWGNQVIKQEQIDKYLINGKDFIDEKIISQKLQAIKTNDKSQIRAIIEKAKSIETLCPDEVALLLNVTDEELWEEMYEAGAEIKRRVYDNRIVFFAPLYCSNLCVNGCKYCGFRTNNKEEKRKRLNMEEIKRETEVIIDEGHKRLIVVYGEHPLSDIDYMCDSIKAVYDVKKKSPYGKGYGNIRRVNVNAAPMSTEDLIKLRDVGIGTYQVFQETYNRNLYKSIHPFGPKSDYRWRLYALHRAMDAGIDDLAIGALFGLYDWKFEVMGLIYHALDLERQFGIGPHTISFPRLMPASGTTMFSDSKYLVDDDQFKKLVTVLRLAVPYTGLIITAREAPKVRDDVINVGCTQIDASSRIGIGGYSQNNGNQEKEKQQFILGDTRSLDEMIKILAKKDTITSFCTAGYRCGRTGDKIMGLLKGCIEGKFCKLNAVLTYKEYLDDYASPETRMVGEKVIQKEIQQIKNITYFKEHGLDKQLIDSYSRVSKGERDIYL